MKLAREFSGLTLMVIFSPWRGLFFDVGHGFLLTLGWLTINCLPFNAETTLIHYAQKAGLQVEE
jgi:hypothetical protein